MLCRTAFLVVLVAAWMGLVGPAAAAAAAGVQAPTVAYATGSAVLGGSPALVTVAFVVPPGGDVAALSTGALAAVGAGPAIQPRPLVGIASSALGDMASSAASLPCSSPPQPGQVHWPQFFDGTANPVVPLLYNPAGDPTGMGATALSNAAATRNGAPGTSYRDVHAGTTNAGGGLFYPTDHLNVVLWANPWPYGNSGEVLAITWVTYIRSTCDIVDADVVINGSFQWTTNGGPGFDLQSVLTHELGHVAGLGHTMDPNAMMFPFFSAGHVKRQLGQEDIFAIDAQYPGPGTYVITGSRVGNITVPPGSTVIVHNATVTGGIHVSAGTALDVENSTISGGLKADSAAAVRVCGSTIGSSVTVTSARAFVLIGDSDDDGCAHNSIGGNLILQDNANGIDAVANQVAGAVIASRNSGAGPDGTGPEITPQAPASPFTTIDVPGALATIPTGISPSGAIVGDFTDSSGTPYGFLDQGGTFTTIDAPGAAPGPAGGTYVSAISPSGAIVGFFVDSSGTQHGFLDQGGTFTTIDAPGAAPGPSGGTITSGISGSGAIVGAYGDSSGSGHGFLDQGGTFTTIDAPGADGPSGGTYANGISPSGAIIGTFYDSSGAHGFLDQAGTFTTIDPPGTIFTLSSGISPTGAIVGAFYDSSFQRHGFLDQGGTFTTIDVPGGHSTFARAISPSGEIVGNYRNPGGQSEGFLLQPPPSTPPAP
jgi:hypothetical protein